MWLVYFARGDIAKVLPLTTYSKAQLLRIFATSDIHIDFPDNLNWLRQLSTQDYTDDLLILAGDISHKTDLIQEAFERFGKSFARVCFIPGNHDLWVDKGPYSDSYQKWLYINQLAEDMGIATRAIDWHGISIIPLHSWYDFSFGKPGEKLRERWVDFEAILWPEENIPPIHAYFDSLNESINEQQLTTRKITFSHFMPRVDLLPPHLAQGDFFLTPVLGSKTLEQNVRRLAPDVHIYGHHHVNTVQIKDNVRYFNNAFGYPNEGHFTEKLLKEISL